MKANTFLIAALASLSLGAHLAHSAEIPGAYSVPVPAELEAYSSYPLARVSWNTVGDESTLVYELPAELTGARNMIWLHGKNTSGANFQMGNDADSARCKREAGNLTCTVTYGELKFSPNERTSLIQNEFTNTEELRARLEVAARFESEPVGVVTFKAPN